MMLSTPEPTHEQCYGSNGNAMVVVMQLPPKLLYHTYLIAFFLNRVMRA